jgi:bacterioferritin-associated ferredoxin
MHLRLLCNRVSDAEIRDALIECALPADITAEKNVSR